MSKKKLYMCSLCGRLWGEEELKLGRKTCRICLASLYSAESTNWLLREMDEDYLWYGDEDPEELLVNEERRRKWLQKHKDEYEVEEFLSEG